MEPGGVNHQRLATPAKRQGPAQAATRRCRAIAVPARDGVDGSGCLGTRSTSVSGSNAEAMPRAPERGAGPPGRGPRGRDRPPPWPGVARRRRRRSSAARGGRVPRRPGRSTPGPATSDARRGSRAGRAASACSPWRAARAQAGSVCGRRGELGGREARSRIFIEDEPRGPGGPSSGASGAPPAARSRGGGLRVRGSLDGRGTHRAGLLPVGDDPKRELNRSGRSLYPRVGRLGESVHRCRAAWRENRRRPTSSAPRSCRPRSCPRYR